MPNTRIIRLNSKTIGLIMSPVRLLVIENDTVVSMGRVPAEVYPINPTDLTVLPWETKVILNAVMVSQYLESPFGAEMSAAQKR